jgi:transposase-like protein
MAMEPIMEAGTETHAEARRTRRKKPGRIFKKEWVEKLAPVHSKQVLTYLRLMNLPVTSDAHEGLKAALRATLNASPWQRCQFHLQQNAQAYVPSLAMRAGVARDIRSVFDSSDLPQAEARLAEIVEKYQKLAPKLASWLEGNLIEGLTVFKLPEHFRRRLRTSNMCERVNREIKRRTRVAGLFPNESSVLRLLTAILMETSDEWETGRAYFSDPSKS